MGDTSTKQGHEEELPSALQFHSRAGNKQFESQNCFLTNCNASGRNRWYILGHFQGFICNHHRKEFIKAWDEARDQTTTKAPA